MRKKAKTLAVLSVSIFVCIKGFTRASILDKKFTDFFFVFVTKSGNGLQPIERMIITNIKKNL